jgi:hypothetical protein
MPSNVGVAQPANAHAQVASERRAAAMFCVGNRADATVWIGLCGGKFGNVMIELDVLSFHRRHDH